MTCSNSRQLVTALGCLVLGALTGWPASSHAQGGSSGLPDSMTRWVPDDAVLAAVWPGRDPEAEPLSEAERTIYSPPFRRFYGGIVEYLQVLVENETDLGVAQLVPAVAGALQSPGVAYVSASPDGTRPVMGFVLADSKSADVVARFFRNVALNLEAADPIQVGQYELRVIVAADDTPIAFGRIDDDFALAFGAGEGQRLLERVESAGPEWIQQFVAKANVDRPVAMVSTNLEKAYSLLPPEMMKDVQAPLLVSGAANVTRLSTMVGFDSEGYVHRTWAEMPDGRGGLLGGLKAGALSAPNLAGLPENATAGIAVDVDIDGLFGSVLESLQIADPNAAEDLEQQYRMPLPGVGEEGIAGVAQSLGSPWTIYHSADEGGWLTGFTAIVPIKDDRVMRKLEQVFLQDLRRQVAEAQWWNRSQLYQSEIDGYQAYSYMSMNVLPALVTWVMTEDHLVVTLSPSNLKPILARIREREEGSSTNLELADDNASMVFAADTKQLLGAPWGAAQFVARIGELEMRWRDFRNGENDVAMMSSNLPHGAVLESIARQDRLAIYPEAKGILIEGRFSLPGSEFVFVSGGLGVFGAWLNSIGIDPAMVFAPGVARQTQTMNNLKQIGLAMHNYHDVFNRLPKAAGTNEDGEPLLSWRVHILPYIEQQNLYDQFRLDEPWDSEHNLKLAEQMPPIYRSPASQAPPGHTNYLTIRSPESMFPPLVVNGRPVNRGTRFADVRDGLSNTIMVVEANDDSAVLWTRPDDLEPDMRIVKQIVGLHRDKIAVGFADGAVRMLPADVDNELFLKLISIAGGEPVGPDDLLQLDGPRDKVPLEFELKEAAEPDFEIREPEIPLPEIRKLEIR